MSLHSRLASVLVLLTWEGGCWRCHRVIRTVNYVSLTMEAFFVYLGDELSLRISGGKLLLLAAYHLNKFVVTISQTIDLVTNFHGAIVVKALDWSVHQ